MNKKRMWLVAISVATMVTASSVVMAATTADKQDNATGKWQQTQEQKGDFTKSCGMRGFHEDKQALLDFLKIDAQAFKSNMKDGKTLAVIAKDQGISEQALTNFMVEQISVHIDRDVKEGRLPEAKATQIKADMKKHVADMVNGKAPMYRHGHMGHNPFHNEKLLDLLKMDKESLKSEMKAGKSLLTIAGEHGVSEQSLKAVMLEEMAQRIEQGVKEGRIPANKAEQIKANMENRVGDMINGKVPMKNHPQNNQQ